MLLKNCFEFFTIFLIFLTDFTISYRVQSEKDALEYLTYYGYVDPEEMPKGFTIKDCNKKLKEFQKLSRVDITGELDSSTLKAMNTPRCGCPDFIHLSFKSNSNPQDRPYHTHHTHFNGSFDHHHSHHYHTDRHGHGHSHDHNNKRGSHDHSQNDTWNSSPHSRHLHRHKRYALSESRWGKRMLTYNIVQFPTRYGMKVSTEEISDAIHKAFNIWEQHINLDFIYQPNDIEADIEISFVSTYHGDNYPFDGPGSTLAHAFFPGTGIGGDIHFEQEENWRVGTYNGIDVLYVAVHEIGHSLGLGHSSNYGAIMYPMYRGYSPNLQLHQDDISGAQAMYGSRTVIPSTTKATPPRTTTQKPTRRPSSTPKTTIHPTNPVKDLCVDSQIDAITTMLGDAVLAFKGPYVYEIRKDGEGVLDGFPKYIESYFRGLEGNLDCVLTRSNGKTYFFKGSKYWRFTGSQMDRGYPRAIAEYFPGIPNNLDAAFEWDGEFVFTKGNNFWRFNTRTKPQVQPFFPMPLSHWGLTKKLDAAFTAPNDTVYFFQGQHYWKFNKTNHQVLNANQGPEISSEDWFGCWQP